MSSCLLLKGENTFLAHVENEVDDAEVGQETMFLLEDLIIRSGAEVGIVGGKTHIRFCLRDVWLNVKRLATFLYQSFIEVGEKSPRTLIERAEVVLEILKERGVEVRGFKRIPVLPLPICVGADADVLHDAFPRHESAAVDRDGEVQRAIGRIDGTTVAEGLFLIVLMLLNENRFARQQMSEP